MENSENKVEKTAIKLAKEAHVAKVREELEAIKDIGEGWRFIKKYGKKSSTPCNQPNAADLYMYYKNLLQGLKEPTTQYTRMDPPYTGRIRRCS